MIRTREEVRAAAEADAQEFSELLDSDQNDTSGIPPPPQIDVSEVLLEANIFDFELAIDPTAESFPGGEGGLGACCDDETNCTVTTEADCDGNFQGVGTDCEPNPCNDCPNPDSVCVTFADIVVCEECQRGVPISIEVDDLGVNGTFVLTKTIDLPALVQWEGIAPGVLRTKQYPFDIPASCNPEDLEEDCINDARIVVQCAGSPANVWSVTYSVSGGSVCMPGWDSQDIEIFRGFYPGNIDFGSTQENEIGCGETGTGWGVGGVDPDSGDPGTVVVVIC